MIDVKKLRTALLVLSVVAFAVVSAFYFNKEKSFCLGVEIIGSKTASEFSVQQADLADILLFDGQPAAVDSTTNTVYIPQKLDSRSFHTEFEKELTSADESYTLYFLGTEYFNNVYQAAKDGHTAILYAVKDNVAVQYNVVFTNLPVMRLDGIVVGQNEDDRDIFDGQMCLWSPQFKSTGSYFVQTSAVNWHYRGNANYYVDKKSVKMTLKDENGENSNHDLIGNEYRDDDWILNAMYMDDTKVREKLLMDMWNDLAAETSYNEKMSTAEYVEVVKNGEYQGLYLLENRIDGKYLELEEDRVLLKGIQGRESPEITDHYSIIQYNYDDEELIWETMEGMFNRDDGSKIQLENWIDVSLFVQLGYMTDNSNRYNNFYIIDNITTDPVITTILWDTDLSLGIAWIDGIFTQSLDIATSRFRIRKEDASLREIYPQLDDMIAQRYAQMRKDTFDGDNIKKSAEMLTQQIENSGALQRDIDKWGTRCNGNDNLEFLCAYIDARFETLDEYYNFEN